MAMLRILSLPELVATDEQSYVHITSDLLANDAKRLALRQRIESQAPKLFDDAKSLDEFRQLLRHQIQPIANFNA
jgi:predicted O-linked N-acetylglucosamine transferase (SPINDLY family)